MFDFGLRQAGAGYRPVYRPKETNHCPGCGGSNWLIGRLSAECARCATAVPFVSGGSANIGAQRYKALAA